MFRQDDLKVAARRARRLAQETYDLRLRAELLAAAETYERQLAEAGSSEAPEGTGDT